MELSPLFTFTLILHLKLNTTTTTAAAINCGPPVKDSAHSAPLRLKNVKQNS